VSVALLKQLGYDVVAFFGKPEQSEHLKSLGAREVLHRDVINNVKPHQPVG
jgi:acrylyl-CoA reductase (NADPH)